MSRIIVRYKAVSPRGLERSARADFTCEKAETANQMFRGWFARAFPGSTIMSVKFEKWGEA